MDGDEQKGVVVRVGKRRAHAPKMIHPDRGPSKLLPRLIKLVILLVLAGGVWCGYQHYKSLGAIDGQCNGRESSQIYKDAGKVLNPGASSQLLQVTRRIKTMKRYDRDPSCLAVLVTYYLGESDLKNATLYMEKLDKLQSDKPFVPTLGPLMEDQKTLGFRVTQLEQQEKIQKSKVDTP